MFASSQSGRHFTCGTNGYPQQHHTGLCQMSRSSPISSTWLTLNAQQQGNGCILSRTLWGTRHRSEAANICSCHLEQTRNNRPGPATQVPTAITIRPECRFIAFLLKFTAACVRMTSVLCIQWSLVPPGAGTLVNGCGEHRKSDSSSGTLADTALINIVTAAPLSILAPAGGVYCTGTVLQYQRASAADVPGVTIQVSDNGKHS